MHHVLARTAGAAALICAAAGCANYTPDTAATPPEPEIEEGLDVSVDAVLLRHGELQVLASMTDGSADVALWTGGECPAEELGHGIATPSSFVWSLGRTDVVRAVRCGIVVKTHGVDDEGHRVMKTAPIAFVVVMQQGESEDVRVESQETAEDDATFVFRTAVRETHLRLGSTFVGAEPEDDEVSSDDDSETRKPVEEEPIRYAKFVVGHDDLADALLGRRDAAVGSAHFPVIAVIGGTAEDLSTDADVVAVDEPTEEPEGEAEGQTEDVDQAGGSIDELGYVLID